MSRPYSSKNPFIVALRHYEKTCKARYDADDGTGSAEWIEAHYQVKLAEGGVLDAARRTGIGDSEAWRHMDTLHFKIVGELWNGI